MNTRFGTAGVALLAIVGIAPVAMGQTCPCDCYFSGDCNSGMFCNWGNLGNEDTCFWRQPKPQGVVGAGCDEIFNDWGQCDGFCTPSLGVMMFAEEDLGDLVTGVRFWALAFDRAATSGGGLADSTLLSYVDEIPFVENRTADRLGRVVIELMMLARGQKSMIFPQFQDYISADFATVDLTGQDCRLEAGRLAMSILIAEIQTPDSGAEFVPDLALSCLDHNLTMRVCGASLTAAECIYQRVQDFADVLARGGRDGAAPTEAFGLGGGCGQCEVDEDCDDADPCTADACDAAGFCMHSPFIPPCDGNGCNDCNGNGLLDECELAEDCNVNGIPDECETNPQCSTDFCGGAADVCPGTVSGTTAGATNDGSASCGSSSGSPDVWYAYTPVNSGVLSVNSCGSSYDTVLSIHTGCPGTSTNQLTCNDDSCGLQSSVSTAVSAGSTYYIRVSGYSGGSGNYNVTVSGPDCEMDLPLPAPIVAEEGSRYISVRPATDSRAVAIQLSAPAYPCIDLYVDAVGRLVESPVFLTPDVWGTVHVYGDVIVPQTQYILTVIAEGALTTASSDATTWMWGDVNNNQVANLEDAFLGVLGFQGNFDLISLPNVDLGPCVPNGVVNLEDVQLAVLAFQGWNYASTACTMPCK